MKKIKIYATGIESIEHENDGLFIECDNDVFQPEHITPDLSEFDSMFLEFISLADENTIECLNDSELENVIDNLASLLLIAEKESELREEKESELNNAENQKALLADEKIKNEF